jgi:hypothetical protein
MTLITAKTAGPMSLVLFGLLCATAQGQPSPLVTGNNEAGGGGIIATTDFPTGPTVHFDPYGGAGANGRGVLVLGNNVYYTKIFPTDKIHIAPFNGGLMGADIGSLPNPRPGCSVQALAYHDGYIYALTGQYTCSPTQVFKVAVGSTAWGAPVSIPGAINNPDGFTVLENNGVLTFLINGGDADCTYNEYDTTGAATGKGFNVVGFGACTGVDTLDSDTDGTHVLYFSVGPAFAQTNTILQATFSVPYGCSRRARPRFREISGRL